MPLPPPEELERALPGLLEAVTAEWSNTARVLEVAGAPAARVEAIALEVRSALVLSSVMSACDRLWASLLVALVDAGVMTSRTALATVACRLGAHGDAGALIALTPRLSADEARDALRITARAPWDRALPAVATRLSELGLGDEMLAYLADATALVRAEVLTAMVPRLPEPLRARAFIEALSAARTLIPAEQFEYPGSDDPSPFRASALLELAAVAGEPARGELVREALELARARRGKQAKKPPYWLARLLAAAGEPEQAFALIRSAPSAFERARLLAGLGPHVHGQLAIDVVDAWLSAGRGLRLVSPLAIPLPLPPSSIQRVVDAMDEREPLHCAVGLVQIAGHHPEALGRARAAVDMLDRSRRLAGWLHLAPHMPPGELRDVLPDLSAWVRDLIERRDAVSDPWHVSFQDAAAMLAALLPPPEREALLRAALAAARRSDDAAQRDEAVAELTRGLAVAGPTIAAAEPSGAPSVEEAIAAIRAAPDGDGDALFSLFAVLGAIAPSDRAMLLRKILLTLAYRTRGEMLASWTKRDLGHLGPLLAAIGGHEAIRAASAQIIVLGAWLP